MPLETVTLSAYYTPELEKLIKDRSKEPYPVEFHSGSQDEESMDRAIKQGIDSHLEAIHFTQITGDHGRIRLTISPETLHVLIRRLMESDQDEDQSLGRDICGTLEIELI